MSINPIIIEAADIIGSGGVVIIPTETFYGIAANPFNEGAIERIYEIKGRDDTNPVPLIAADIFAVREVADMADGIVKKLATTFWPGSLTILLTPSRFFPKHLIGPTGKIGIRVPPPCPALQLAEYAGGLITATSANLSGHAPAASVWEIPDALTGQVDLVLDFGQTPGGAPSTVIEVVDNSIRILRQGIVNIASVLSSL